MTEVVIEERFGFVTEEDAQVIAQTLRLNGYTVEVSQEDDGTWMLRAYPPGFGSTEPALNPQDPEAQPVAPIPDPPVGGVKGLLDFIAKFESNGNYNAFFRNAGNTNNPQLTGMMIRNVVEFQNRLLANGSPSSAVGRYQIIRQTFRGLIASMSLSGDERFSQDVQDSMGRKLLETRGLNAYLNGTMSVNDFGNAVAKEWAGMPVLSAITGQQGFTLQPGQSFYAGDGLNKALAGAAAFRRAIEGART